MYIGCCPGDSGGTGTCVYDIVNTACDYDTCGNLGVYENCDGDEVCRYEKGLDCDPVYQGWACIESVACEATVRGRIQFDANNNGVIDDGVNNIVQDISNPLCGGTYYNLTGVSISSTGAENGILDYHTLCNPEPYYDSEKVGVGVSNLSLNLPAGYALKAIGSTAGEDGTCSLAGGIVTCNFSNADNIYHLWFLIGLSASPPPIGNFDGCNCTSMYGWTCDADSFSTSLGVNFYDGATFIGSTTANQPREPAVAALCGGNANHGFTFTTPESIKNGTSHTITAYAVNTPPGTNPSLGSCTLTCSTPTCTATSTHVCDPAGTSLTTTWNVTSANFTPVAIQGRFNPLPYAGWPFIAGDMAINWGTALTGTRVTAISPNTTYSVSVGVYANPIDASANNYTCKSNSLEITCPIQPVVTIQGVHAREPGGVWWDPVLFNIDTTLSNPPTVWSVVDPYYFYYNSNPSPVFGAIDRIVSVPAVPPAGYTLMGSTICYNAAGCQTPADSSNPGFAVGNTRGISDWEVINTDPDPALAKYVDLWWHDCPVQTVVPTGVSVSPNPACAASTPLPSPGTMSWTAVTGAAYYTVLVDGRELGME
jgi:hypothetical protein